MIYLEEVTAEEITAEALAEAREINLEEIQRLGPAYDSLIKTARHDFKDAMEYFHAADIMLRYFTTQEQYQALVS